AIPLLDLADSASLIEGPVEQLEPTSVSLTQPLGRRSPPEPEPQPQAATLASARFWILGGLALGLVLAVTGRGLLYLYASRAKTPDPGLLAEARESDPSFDPIPESAHSPPPRATQHLVPIDESEEPTPDTTAGAIPWLEPQEVVPILRPEHSLP